MSPESDAGAALLERAYADLDLVGGTLLQAATGPGELVSDDDWRGVGDWLLLAERVGADRMFFVNDDPVLVFSRLPSRAAESDVVEMYRRMWCLSRPRCLFLALDDELRVYALSEPPAAGDEGDAIRPIEVLGRTADVAEVLADFHRERLESGAAFESMDPRGGATADRQLLRDVAAATDALIESGLARHTAHVLIERAILVRYLEDREVLTPAYFDAIARRRLAWRRHAENVGSRPAFGPDSAFIRFLSDRSLTNALFEQLAVDFNGDLFVPETDETDTVTDEHLRLLQAMLQGSESATQEQLFLWAYDFSVVPTSLVSMMYELFYHQEAEGRSTSTYYTPPQLVEFVLAEVLTDTVLEKDPRVCDPACGSGVFLVEAFRRIVRHEMTRRGGQLTSDRLRELLLDRVMGVDVNEAAIRLAAFSLYVAFLNYQTPQDIRQAGELPPLIARPQRPAPLAVGDAFSPARAEPGASREGPQSTLPWPEAGFGVVVGNPPWTEPPRQPRSTAEQWAQQNQLTVGDRNLSQLFLWRALDLLSDDGVAALLIGAKALLNSRTTAQRFRREWLSRARLEHVVNFIEVRGDYFEGAKAPFALLKFRKDGREPDGPVVYENARKTLVQRGSLAYARLDRRVVSQAALRESDFLWKTYMAGGHRDEALVFRLIATGQLRDLLSAEAEPHLGYQHGRPGERAAHPPADWLRDLPSLERLHFWGELDEACFEPVPVLVKFVAGPAIFHGRRLVVRLGVAPGFGLHARLESTPFAFTHKILGIPLGHRPEWQARVALGTLLSSVGRYWLAMVSGGWGVWRDQVRKEALLDLPVRLTTVDDPRVERIAAAVRALPSAAKPAGGARELWEAPDGQVDTVGAILHEIDAAVADLFELTQAERDLVGDFWDGQRPGALASIGEIEPRAGTMAHLRDRERSGLAAYLQTFLEVWNGQLGGGELSWKVIRDGRAGLICAIFETRDRDAPFDDEGPDDLNASWTEVLARLDKTLTRQRAATLHSHGMVRLVTETAIVIVKRDERRLWTPSAARDDAEATTVQAMALSPA